MDPEQQTTNVSLGLLHATTQTIKHTHTPLSLKVKAVVRIALVVP